MHIIICSSVTRLARQLARNQRTLTYYSKNLQRELKQDRRVHARWRIHAKARRERLCNVKDQSNIFFSASNLREDKLSVSVCMRVHFVNSPESSTRAVSVKADGFKGPLLVSAGYRAALQPH